MLVQVELPPNEFAISPPPFDRYLAGRIDTMEFTVSIEDVKRQWNSNWLRWSFVVLFLIGNLYENYYSS